MSNKISKDIILISGGAGGIGSSVVKKYIDENCHVIVFDNNIKNINMLKQKYSDNFESFIVDVSNYEEIRAIVNTLEERYGYINHLISLAGGALETEFGGIETTDKDTIDKSIDINLKSHLYLIKQLLPQIKASTNLNKSIILISSINALRDYGLPAYSSAKAGILGTVNSLSSELGEMGIRINAILPGTVPTPRTLSEPKDFEVLKHGSPLGRFSTTEDVAKSVWALTHIMTSVHSEKIVVDCGQVAKTPRYSTF